MSCSSRALFNLLLILVVSLFSILSMSCSCSSSSSSSSSPPPFPSFLLLPLLPLHHHFLLFNIIQLSYPFLALVVVFSIFQSLSNQSINQHLTDAHQLMQ